MALLKSKNKSLKDKLNRLLYARVELSKFVLKSLLSSPFFSLDNRLFFYKKFIRFSFKSSISFFFRSCLFTGFSKTVFHLFKLSRHQLKKWASNGFIVGLRKSSF